MNHLEERNRAAFASWLFRQYLIAKGSPPPPDPRDQELRDAGAVLIYRARCLRRALRHQPRRYEYVRGIGLRITPRDARGLRVLPPLGRR